MTLQFERKYSTQGSGAPCHVSFGFFSPDFLGFSCQDFRWTLSQSARLNLRLRGYSIWSAILQIAPPYQLRLLDKTGIF
jgi:hypothetical protein